MTPSGRGCQHCVPKGKLPVGWRQAGCRARCARSHTGGARREMGPLGRRGHREDLHHPGLQNAGNWGHGSEIFHQQRLLKLNFNSWCFPEEGGVQCSLLGVWVFLLLICQVIFLLSLISLFSFLHAFSPIKSHKRLSKVSLLFSLLSPHYRAVSPLRNPPRGAEC